MKYLINSMLRRIGVQLVRTETLDRLQAQLDRSSFLDDVYGHKMFVEPADQGLRLARFVGTAPTASEDRYFVESIRPGQTVLDLGANVGLYTLLFAKLVGRSGHVLAVEPGPKSFALLVRNIAINGYQNVRAENAAVTDHSGSIELFVCPTGESDNRVSGTIDPGNNWERISVRCFAVDDVVQDRQIDFVKMDIQGSEFPALRGMRKMLAQNPEVKIVMEFCPELIDDKSAFFRFVEEIGMSFFDMNHRPLTAGSLMAMVGNAGQPAHINIVLRR